MQAKGVDKKAMEKFKKYNLEYPKGCIIAKADITDCISIDDNSRKMLKKKNSLVYSNIIKNNEWIGYGFKIENIEKMEPIEVNGKLSLWNYDYKKEGKND